MISDPKTLKKWFLQYNLGLAGYRTGMPNLTHSKIYMNQYDCVFIYITYMIVLTVQ